MSGDSQSARLDKLRIHAQENQGRLFRNNVGEAWTGEHRVLKPIPDILRKMFRLALGVTTVLIIVGYRRIKYGLTVGSSDLIGWKSVTVTPEMVGQKIAVFWAMEEKYGLDRVKPEQANFLNQVHESGGLAEIAYTKNGKTEIKTVGEEGV